MTRQIYSLIDAAGFVVGLVLWNGVDTFDARRFKFVLADGAQIGWTYGSGIFSAPDEAP